MYTWDWFVFFIEMLTQEDVRHEGCFMTRKIQSSGRTLAGRTLLRGRCSLWDPSEKREGKRRQERAKQRRLTELVHIMGEGQGATRLQEGAHLKTILPGFPPKRNHALWGVLMGDTLGLMEDFSRISLLAASIYLIRVYSAQETMIDTGVMKNYAWDYLCLHKPLISLRGSDLHRDIYNLIRLVMELHGKKANAA